LSYRLLGIINFGHSHLLHLVGLFLGIFRAWCDRICPHWHLSFWLKGIFFRVTSY